MIIDMKKGQNILKSGAKHICFAINAEGRNTSGFAALIDKEHWPGLSNIGEHKLGTCITHEDNGVYYHALVCHSLEHGWQNMREVIKQCFDAIETDEEVATIAIGTGVNGLLYRANFYDIFAGMMDSKAKITLF